MLLSPKNKSADLAISQRWSVMCEVDVGYYCLSPHLLYITIKVQYKYKITEYKILPFKHLFVISFQDFRLNAYMYKCP